MSGTIPLRTKLDLTFDLAQLRAEVLDVWEEYGPATPGPLSQINLTHIAGDTDPLRMQTNAFSLVGTPYWERDFVEFDSRIINSYIKTVHSMIPHPLCRFRIIRMEPGFTYRLHKDSTRRIHIPLVSNPGCTWNFPDDNVTFHLPEGECWLIDTFRWHTHGNTGDTVRWHLVGSIPEETVLPEGEFKLFPDAPPPAEPPTE